MKLLEKRDIARFMSLFFLLIYVMPLQAEQCWQMSGCEGMIGWFRVNKYEYEQLTSRNYQNASNALFGSNELPQVNSTVNIKRRAKLRSIQWDISSIVACHDHIYRKGETSQDCDSSDGHYDFMGPGTVVRILGYHQGIHLFALVQVISYPPDPHKAAREASYDEDQEI